jgi:hypothetical protein
MIMEHTNHAYPWYKISFSFDNLPATSMAIFRGYVRSQLKTIPNNSAETGGMNPSNWWFVIAFGTFQGFKLVLSIYWKLFRQLSGFEGPIWNPAIFWLHIKGIYIIYVYLCIYICVYIYTHALGIICK